MPIILHLVKLSSLHRGRNRPRNRRQREPGARVRRELGDEAQAHAHPGFAAGELLGDGPRGNRKDSPDRVDRLFWVALSFSPPSTSRTLRRAQEPLQAQGIDFAEVSPCRDRGGLSPGPEAQPRVPACVSFVSFRGQ